MRADVKRFAAHKAHYVHRKLQEIDKDTTIPTGQKEAYKEQAMRTFHRWGEAEYNYAVQSTQMAEQWENFAKDGDRYYLQYRTAADEKVRAEHAILHNTTLPIDDPFWQQFMPPNGWNCRCTVVQVRKDKYAPTDSTTAYQAGEAATSKQPSFRFNPGATKTCFPDNVSYYKHAGRNRAERERTEKACEIMAQKAIKASAKQSELLQKSIPCRIAGEMQDVHFSDWGIAETAFAMYGSKDLYWKKNEVLNNPERYFKNAKYVASANVDLSHNTNKNRLRLKRHFVKYYYSEITLASGETAYLNIVLHDNGKYYLYTISKNIPTH